MPPRPQFETYDSVKICWELVYVWQHRDPFARPLHRWGSVWLLPVGFLWGRDQESQAQDRRGPHWGVTDCVGSLDKAEVRRAMRYVKPRADSWVQSCKTVLKRCPQATNMANWPSGIMCSGTMCLQIKHVRFLDFLDFKVD